MSRGKIPESFGKITEEFMLKCAGLRPIERAVLAATWRHEGRINSREFLSLFKNTMRDDYGEDWLDDKESVDILVDALRRC
jgi:DNA-binding response OmpR family regulator